MEDRVLRELQKTLEGEVRTDMAARRRVRHDKSPYELLPDVVIAPRHATDIEQLVRIVMQQKALFPKLSITPRGAGTDRSGGAIGNSIVLDLTAHLTDIQSPKKIASRKEVTLRAQAGVPLDSIESRLVPQQRALGFAPHNRTLSTLGGAIANDTSGESALRDGSVRRAVRALDVVLADGNTYTIKPLTKAQLLRKIATNSYEATLYRRVYELIEKHYDVIHNSRPRTLKNTMGYALWDVWDRETEVFDMTQLFTGSQGTLGIVTDVTVATVEQATHSGILLVRVPTLSRLDAVLSTITRHAPSALEGFDNATATARRTTKAHRFTVKRSALLLAVRMEGMSQREVSQKIEALFNDLQPQAVRMDIATTRSTHYHRLRERDAHPLVDDMIVRPSQVPLAIARLRRVIKKHKLSATIEGRFGDGTLRIVAPLTTVRRISRRRRSQPTASTQYESLMRDIIPIITACGGTMAGEHNDGMIRGPWLPAVFGQEMYSIFREVKELFDPLYIFNPHKKTDASLDFSLSHLRED